MDLLVLGNYVVENEADGEGTGLPALGKSKDGVSDGRLAWRRRL